MKTEILIPGKSFDFAVWWCAIAIIVGAVMNFKPAFWLGWIGSYIFLLLYQQIYQ